MPKYKCENKDCTMFNIIQSRSTILKVIDGSLVDSGRECPKCGKLGLAIKEDGMTTNMRGGRNICAK